MNSGEHFSDFKKLIDGIEFEHQIQFVMHNVQGVELRRLTAEQLRDEAFEIVQQGIDFCFSYSAEECVKLGPKLFEKVALGIEKILPLYRFLVPDEKKAEQQEELEIEKVNSFDTGQRFWVYAPGAGASMFDAFFLNGIMAIGWSALGDLTQYREKEDVRAALRKYIPGDGSRKNDTEAIFAFSKKIKKGDVVFAKRGIKTLLAYGIVTGDYEFRPDGGDYPNVRRVDWKEKGEWNIEGEFARKTLTDVTPYKEYVKKIREMIGTDQAGGKGIFISEDVPAYGPSSEVQGIWEGSFESDELVENGLALLRRNKNLLLRGAPGTGKTFLARQLAISIAGSDWQDRIETIQIHQSYSYEDFVQGFRPNEQGGLKLQNGHFLKLCDRARVEPNKNFVITLDEINRGNISKIFGEILVLIEVDKRHEKYKVRLAYDHSATGEFYVPQNVYVIGTMNTADRSLASLDYAFRRRFAFLELKPLFASEDYIEHLTEAGVNEGFARKLSEKLIALNNVIANDIRMLGPGFEVGHSYFSNPPKQRESDRAWYLEVIESQVAPLIRDYWFEDAQKAEKEIRALSEI